MNSNSAVVRSDYNVDADNFLYPIWEIKAGVDLTARPLMALTTNDYSGSPAVITKFIYSLTRNSSTNRLEFDSLKQPATSATPSPTPGGYVFKNGPVQLHSGTYADTVTNGKYNASLDNGSMLLCSDCAAGSTPCSDSGGGALAIRVAAPGIASKYQHPVHSGKPKPQSSRLFYFRSSPRKALTDVKHCCIFANTFANIFFSLRSKETNTALIFRAFAGF